MDTNIKEAAEAIMAMRNSYRQSRDKDMPKTGSRALDIDHLKEELELKRAMEGDDFELRGVNLLEPGSTIPSSTRAKLTANAQNNQLKIFTPNTK